MLDATLLTCFRQGRIACVGGGFAQLLKGGFAVVKRHDGFLWLKGGGHPFLARSVGVHRCASMSGLCLLLHMPRLTFRTLFRTAEAIFAEPFVERGAGARYRLCHAL